MDHPIDTIEKSHSEPPWEIEHFYFVSTVSWRTVSWKVHALQTITGTLRIGHTGAPRRVDRASVTSAHVIIIIMNTNKTIFM